MKRRVSARFGWVLSAWVCLVGATALPVWAEFTEAMSFDADHVVVHNLIGEIRIEDHSGPNIEVVVRVQGSDASTDLIGIVRNGDDELTVKFPVKETRKYVYPRLGGGSTNISGDGDRGWLAELFGAMGGGIKVRGRGSGLEVWADVTVRVPRGKSVEIDHGVGKILAEDVEGDLTLAVRSGRVSVAGITGSVNIDTGSGSVTAEDVRGDLSADTGSGKVTVQRHQGSKLHVDTGSGSVGLDAIEAENLHVDTGSGSVKARSVATDGATIDTGSGSVLLELTRMGGDKFDIDTGSGSITLVLPPDASAEISADTGSGGIHIDLEGDYSVRQEDRDEAEIRVGGGAARVVLDTGSGSIRISQ